jgi:hypothetical protein
MSTKLSHQVFCHLVLIQGRPFEKMIAKCGHHRWRDTGGSPIAIRRRLRGVKVLHVGSYPSDGALAAACLFGDLGDAQCAKLDHAGQMLVLSDGQVWRHDQLYEWGLLVPGPLCQGRGRRGLVKLGELRPDAKTASAAAGSSPPAARLCTNSLYSCPALHHTCSFELLGIILIGVGIQVLLRGFHTSVEHKAFMA